MKLRNRAGNASCFLPFQKDLFASCPGSFWKQVHQDPEGRELLPLTRWLRLTGVTWPPTEAFVPEGVVGSPEPCLSILSIENDIIKSKCTPVKQGQNRE